jgi:hypothetical protein
LPASVQFRSVDPLSTESYTAPPSTRAALPLSVLSVSVAMLGQSAKSARG